MHLFMKLDEKMTIIGQAEALNRVKGFAGVFNVKAHGQGYKVDLAQPGYAMAVVRQARQVNCVDHIIPCRHLAA